jgi:hypothetical protein
LLARSSVRRAVRLLRCRRRAPSRPSWRHRPVLVSISAQLLQLLVLRHRTTPRSPPAACCRCHQPLWCCPPHRLLLRLAPRLCPWTQFRTAWHIRLPRLIITPLVSRVGPRRSRRALSPLSLHPSRPQLLPVQLHSLPHRFGRARDCPCLQFPRLCSRRQRFHRRRNSPPRCPVLRRIARSMTPRRLSNSHHAQASNRRVPPRLRRLPRFTGLHRCLLLSRLLSEPGSAITLRRTLTPATLPLLLRRLRLLRSRLGAQG